MLQAHKTNKQNIIEKQPTSKTNSDFLIVLNLNFQILFFCQPYCSFNKFQMLVFLTFLDARLELGRGYTIKQLAPSITRPLHAPGLR